MPKEKSLTRCIPKVYKRSAENIMLFTWVNAQKNIVPTITQDQAILNFFRFANIDIDEWDLESARIQLTRMQRDFYDDCRETT